MPRRNVSYRPVRYFLRRTNINSSRSKDQPNVKEGTNRLQAQNDSVPNHNKAGNSYPINNILVLPQNSDTLINVISPNSKTFSFKKVFKKLNSRRRKEKQRLKKAQAKVDIKPDIKKIKLNMKKSTINRHTIILSDSEDETFIKNEPKNTSDKSSDKSNTDDDVILVEVNKANEVIEIEDSCNDDLNNSKTEGVHPQYKTTERSELLSTPESTSNDFLENSQPSTNSNFNFGLHGSEFKDSEFLKPSVPVDVSESGSVSSVSDIASSIKANVFNVVDFPKEKENLFDENSLDKFKDSITPQRHSLRDDVNLNRSKDEQRNLPTLSHIQTDDSQLRRVRGRSIIRELVNDRAYVLLASAERKIKKKRKSRDETEVSTLESEVGESMSSDSMKKKKKRKKRKDNEGNDDPYCQFTEDVDTTTISSPMKNLNENKKEKHKKVETAVDIENTNEQFSLVVRNDLFPEMEADTSVSSKKTKKKEKEICITEEIEHKKKHKKSKKQIDDTPEIVPDSTRKRRKEKSLSECSNTETFEVGKHKSKKKKRKTLDSDENLIIDDGDTTADQIEVSEVNEVIIPVIKHQKKLHEIESVKKDESIVSPQAQATTIIDDVLDEKSCTIEINDIPTMTKNLDESLNQIKTSKEASVLDTRLESVDIVYLDSDTKMILNELPESINSESVVIIPETLEKGIDSNPRNSDSKKRTHSLTEPQDPTPQPLRCNPINIDSDRVEKKNETDNSHDKSQSVWNMCSSNFFASSESLFVVSDVRTVTDTENKPEVIEAPVEVQGISSLASESSSNVEKLTESQSLASEENRDKQIPLEKSHGVEQVSKPMELEKCEEKSTQNSSNSQNPNEKDVPVLMEVKEERADNEHRTDIDGSQNIEVNTIPHIPGTSSAQPTEEITVKNEPVDVNKEKESQNPDVVTVKSSSFLNNESELSKKTDTLISPDVIKTIIQEKDNIKSVTKLCEFLEEAKDPNDVLRKVSMIKQAFLAESNAETTPPCITTSNDDVFSVSDDSDSSSIMCIEDETAIVDIEDDISLANCDVTQAVVQDNAQDVRDENIRLDSNKGTPDEIIIKANRQVEATTSSVVLRCGEAGSYARNLDRYEVEAIQSGMKNDPKLWQISSDDLPANRRAVKQKRCIKCKEIGHLVMNCPNRHMLPKCYLCGLEGHLDFRCPNKVCTKCGAKSASMQSYCNQCKHYGRIVCSLCTMRGHPRNKCPDLWRRYHLTINDGPLVVTDGMLLKNKEELWCSSCAKRGHLEYYCYAAMKNRSFQQLDPRIHHYEDVYQTSKNNTSVGGVVSKKALHEIQKYMDNLPAKTKDNVDLKTRETPKSDISKNYTSICEVIAKNTPQEIQKNLDNPPGKTRDRVNVNAITKEIPIELPKENIGVPVIASVEQSSGHSELENLPGFVVIDEVTTESREHSICESSEPANESVQINEITLEDKTLEKNVNSSDNSNILDGNPEKTDVNIPETNTTNCDQFESIQKFIKNKLQKCDRAGSDLFIPDLDMKTFFMGADVDLLKKFLSKELECLENFSVKIKDMFFKYHAYDKDSKKDIDERDMNPKKHRCYEKQLNMLVFGKEHLKSGKIRLLKLVFFVKNPTGFFTDAMRESLYSDYDYIFSDKKHEHTQYGCLLRLLMDKYGYRKKQK